MNSHDELQAQKKDVNEQVVDLVLMLELVLESLLSVYMIYGVMWSVVRYSSLE